MVGWWEGDQAMSNYSIGSINWVRDELRNIKFMWQPLAAIFL